MNLRRHYIGYIIHCHGTVSGAMLRFQSECTVSQQTTGRIIQTVKLFVIAKTLAHNGGYL